MGYDEDGWWEDDDEPEVRPDIPTFDTIGSIGSQINQIGLFVGAMLFFGWIFVEYFFLWIDHPKVMVAAHIVTIVLITLQYYFPQGIF